MKCKEIIAVYQDCVLCGDKGRKKIAECATKGVLIRKVGFTTPEGKDLIHKAVLEHKIGSMPFFTDGENFSTSLDDFVASYIPEEKVGKYIKTTIGIKKPAKSVKKRAKKPAKSVKESEDVAV